MKIEVHTIRFGRPKWLVTCAKTLDDWTERHGMKLHVWTDSTSKQNGYPDVKFCVVDMLRLFLSGESDQMMYVDADVYIHHDAPFPEFGPGMHIRPHADRIGAKFWLPWLAEHFDATPSSWIYHNAGVWIVDRESAQMLLDVISEPYIAGIMEQNHFNWWVHLARQNGIKLNALPLAWNRYPRDTSPAWFFHIYGQNKDSLLRKILPSIINPIKHTPKLIMKTQKPIRNNVIIQGVRPVVKVKPARPAHSRMQWPMHMDDLHLRLLDDIISENRPDVAMEIGSHHGVSTQVFLDALSDQRIQHLHIVEPVQSKELLDRIERSGQASKITMHTKSSWEIMQKSDMVFIDGDHRWGAIADLASALALNVPIIAMHDTATFMHGMSACWGSALAADILRKAEGRAWFEHREETDNAFTHRGFGWSVASTQV